jgi:hypothetical protein
MRENDLLTDMPRQSLAPKAADVSSPITWPQYLDILFQIGHQELSRRRAIEKALGLPASEIARSQYRYALARLARVSEVDRFWANAARAMRMYREAVQVLLNTKGRLGGGPAAGDEALAKLVEEIKRTEREMRRPASDTIAQEAPGDIAVKCFRMHVIRRMTYGEIAAVLNRRRMQKIPEWRICRWIKQVTDWIMSDSTPPAVGPAE